MSTVAAVVLAAGRGTRYRASGGTAPSKLIATIDARPLIRHVVEAALGSAATPVIVVTGHAQDHIRAALAGLPVQFVHNAGHANGLAGSLKVGVAAVPPEATGAVVLLGDMPRVTSTHIERVLAQTTLEPDADAVVPIAQGRRGNPVFLSRRLFSAVDRLEGDAGARHLLRDPRWHVREFALDDPAATLDVDEAGDIARLAAEAS